MTKSQLIETLKSTLLKLEEEACLSAVNEAIKLNLSPEEVLQNGLAEGIKSVGDLFEKGEYFLADMLVAADIMNKAFGILEPKIKEAIAKTGTKGTVVMGTVKGDIHDIGKTIVVALLRSAGFTVHDLGMDVPPVKFVEKAKEMNANLVASSSLLTTTRLQQRVIEQELEKAGIRGQVKTMIGGLAASQEWADEIGADGYSEDAFGAVEKALDLIN